MHIPIIIILFFILFMVLQAGHLKKEFITIGKGELDIRIALISDLHMGLLLVSEEDVSKALKGFSPDVLIIAGDILDKEKHVQDFVTWFKKVSPKCPVFVTLGNHDHCSFNNNPIIKNLFFSNLKSLGIEILINNTVTFCKNGESINIVGIDDYKYGCPNIKQALSLKDKSSDFTLVVSHNPEIALSMPKDEIDLLLSGHFHGGQIWIPFGLEFALLRREETCKSGYRRGMHTINGIPTYISRGIGNVIVPCRLGSLPEITFIDL